MKKLFLILCTIFLSSVFIKEVQAEFISCINGVREDGVTTCNKCGAHCDWSVDTTNGKLRIFGSGNMNDYRLENEPQIADRNQPWVTYKQNITSVDVSGVSSVGYGAFDGFTHITDVSIGDSVEKIGVYAFRTSPVENLSLGNSVNSIGRYAFQESNFTSLVIPEAITSLEDGTFQSNVLESVVIPDTITRIDSDVFGRNIEHLKNLDIICKGGKESCTNIKKYLGKYRYYDDGWKIIDLSQHFSVAGFTECSSTNYFWNGAECVRQPDVSKRKCCDSCKDMGGYCNRIRYTPAEAAAILNDDDNEITITFKK